jgi:hypothetical protein
MNLYKWKNFKFKFFFMNKILKFLKKKQKLKRTSHCGHSFRCERECPAGTVH